MKNLLLLTLVIASTLSGNTASAHALWIATPPTAHINQPHHIQVFYGEYATQEIEPVGKWYSDVKDFTLWLTTPDQQKIQLEKQENPNFFQSSFTPSQDGIYTLTIVHTTKDLGGTTRLEFSSTSFVTVGNIHLNAPVSNVPLHVYIKPTTYKKDQQVDAIIYDGNTPLANAEIIVMSEQGWSKVFRADANGQLSFPVLWSGNYVIEASHSYTEDGIWHGKPYERIWRGATTFLKVK